VTLTDTGPLVALINRHDPNHTVCVDATKRLPTGPLVTTWPCFTEAMYLLFQGGGYPAQAELWRWRTARQLVLHHLVEEEIDRMATLMQKYRDRPMGLADASLVVAAERLGLRRVFPLDSDFHIYR
jgi:predicted nucleic acid-binding protein